MVSPELENSLHPLEPLIGDPHRRASPTERGFIYQFWRTVESWIDLKSDEVLYVEGAEDFDKLASDHSTATQIKDDKGSGSLTLTSAIQAINNYWTLKTNNPGRRIHFQYVTTRAVGEERQGLNGKKGVEIWQACRVFSAQEATTGINELKAFLLSQNTLNQSLVDFLSTKSETDIYRELVSPFEWLPDQPGLDDLKDKVLAKLLVRTQPKGLPVTEVERLAKDLYLEVEQAAIQKTPQALNAVGLERRVDLFTFIQVPRVQETGAVLSGMFETLLAHIAPHGQTIPAVKAFPPSFPLPVLPEGLWRRATLIDNIFRVLQASGVTYVHGSTGTGKTTLVQQALVSISEVLWLDLRDFGPQEIATSCRHLIGFVNSQIGKPTVVLDDFNLQGDSRLVETELGRLLSAIKHRDGGVVVISYTPPVPRIAAILGVDEPCQVPVPPFTVEEIASYLTWLGCDNSGQSELLGRFVWAHSSGHPQLVSVRVRALAAAGFPLPTAKDLSRCPKEMQDVLTEAISLIRTSLPAPARDLIYRLSLVSGLFSRSHVLRIAKVTPSIDRAGEYLDTLIGPWLEQPISGCYRVSPLARQAGAKMLEVGEVNVLHGEIALAMLSSSPLSIHEFAIAVNHAVIGESEGVIPIIMTAFVNAPKEIRNAIAEEVNWIKYIGLGSATRVPFSNTVALQFFRLFQWEVASLSDPESLGPLAKAMDREFPVGGTDPLCVLPRIIFLSKLLMQTEVLIPINEFVHKMLELPRLVKSANQLGQDFGIGKNLPAMPFGRNKATLLDWFSGSLAFQVKGSADLAALTRVIDALTPPERNKLLGIFPTDDEDLRVLFSGAWHGVPQGNKQAQEDFANVLRNSIDAGKRWGNRPWIGAATRLLAVVLDESLHQPDKAREEIEQTTEEYGATPNLSDQLALIDFNHERYESALTIWRQILPGWKVDDNFDMQPVLSSRLAAICAANLEYWAESAELFKSAWLRAKKFNQKTWSLGLLADRAFALWQAGQRIRSIHILVKVVKTLEDTPNNPDSFTEYALHKKVGVITSTFAGIPLEASPLPGMCSSPSHDKGIGELPPTLVEYQWNNLFRIADTLGESKLRTVLLARIVGVPFATIRFFAKDAMLRDAIKNGAAETIFDCAIQVAKEAEKIIARGDSPPHLPDAQGLGGEITERTFNVFVFPALVGVLTDALTNGQNVVDLIEHWLIKSRFLEPTVQILIREIQVIANYDISQLEAVLINAQESERRRTMAAALLCGNGNDPKVALYAHVLFLTNTLGTWLYRHTTGASFDQLVRRDWRRFAETPFRLINPQLNIPPIKAFCSQTKSGWGAAADLILAAIPAVSLKIPREMIQKLNEISDS